MPNLAKANAVISQYRKDMRDANSTAKKPRICTQKAVSRLLTIQATQASVSMNDILDSINGTGFMIDPLQRQRIIAASSALSKTFNKF